MTWTRAPRSARRAPAALRLLLLLLAAALTLSGCGFSVYSLPLPGGPDVGNNPMTIKAQFRDVLDLVPKSTVKVDDITVGEITDIQVDGWTAMVTMEVNRDVDLPDNATAQIRQTSLLGEKFVSLEAPSTGADSNRLGNGDVIPLSRTGRNPEVEEVLGALSLVLNGGGVAQLKTIATELNKALSGREDSARSVLDQINGLVSTLDNGKQAIVQAITQLDRLARTARSQQGNIDLALEQLPSALKSLDAQRADLVTMLQALNKLGDVGVRVIQASKDDTIASIRQLQPVLGQLAASGDNFVKAFNVALTYPFIDEVVGRDPQVARNLQMGDYTNLSVRLDLNLGDLLPSTTGLPTDLPTILDPTKILSDVTKCIQSGDLNSKACKKVLAKPAQLLQLQKECKKDGNKNKQVCKQLNQLPGLPTAGASLPTKLPSIKLPGVVNRPGYLQIDPKRGPTMGQLQQVYDPALVDLLVPGMVTK